MNSPFDSPDLTPSADEVQLYLDSDDQKIVIGALIQILRSSEINRQAVIDSFPDRDPTATAVEFQNMIDKTNAILARLR